MSLPTFIIKIVLLIVILYEEPLDYWTTKTKHINTFYLSIFTFLFSWFISSYLSFISKIFRDNNLFYYVFLTNYDFSWTFLTIYYSNLSSNSKYFFYNYWTDWYNYDFSLILFLCCDYFSVRPVIAVFTCDLFVKNDVCVSLNFAEGNITTDWDITPKLSRSYSKISSPLNLANF